LKEWKKINKNKMKCKIFRGDIATVEKDINEFFSEHTKPSFEIVSVTQTRDDIDFGHIIITIIFK